MRRTCFVLVVVVSACRARNDAPATPPAPSVAVTNAAAPPSSAAPRDAPREWAPDEGPVRTEDVAVAGDRPAIVVRGSHSHARAMLFLAGMCVHPGGFVMAFQHSAAAHGDLVGVQGDVECGHGSGFRMWSSDLEKMDRRIEAAFRAAGLGAPRDVVVIGNSQGAERAERLIARWPEKYSSAILIGSPVTPSVTFLRRARSVATMSGTYDVAFAKMRDGSTNLQRAGVRSQFFPIKDAWHGSFGAHPEDAMFPALAFVAEDEPR